MNTSLYQLTLTNFRVFFREPAIIFWAALFPIIMAWVLGIAFSGKGESVRTIYVIGQEIPGNLSGERVFGENTGNPSRIKFKKASEEDADDNKCEMNAHRHRRQLKIAVDVVAYSFYRNKIAVSHVTFLSFCVSLPGI